MNVCEAALGAGTRKIVFAGSGGTIYGVPESVPVKESHSQHPTSPYGVSKKAAVDYLFYYREIHGLEYTVLALANVYGPRQDPHGEAGVVAIFGGALLAGKQPTINGDGKQTRDYVFVDDVVDAFVRATEKGGGLLMNIGTGVETSVVELFEVMARLTGFHDEARLRPREAGRAAAVGPRPGPARRSTSAGSRGPRSKTASPARSSGTGSSAPPVEPGSPVCSAGEHPGGHQRGFGLGHTANLHRGEACRSRAVDIERVVVEEQDALRGVGEQLPRRGRTARGRASATRARTTGNGGRTRRAAATGRSGGPSAARWCCSGSRPARPPTSRARARRRRRSGRPASSRTSRGTRRRRSAAPSRSTTPAANSSGVQSPRSKLRTHRHVSHRRQSSSSLSMPESSRIGATPPKSISTPPRSNSTMSTSALMDVEA